MPVYHPLDLALTPAGYGQCRLDYVSASVIRLSRYNGLLLTIDGTPQQIPVAGVDLAPTGLTALTNYLVYAYMNAGVMTLEASTTSWTYDPRNGMRVKSGDATRTLIGQVRPLAGPVWSDTLTYRGVASWFNQLAAVLAVGVDATISATSYTGLSTALSGLSWGLQDVRFNGYAYNTTSGAACISDVWVDGAGAGGTIISYSRQNGDAHDMTQAMFFNSGEGFHSFQHVGYVSSGSGRWVGVFGASYMR